MKIQSLWYWNMDMKWTIPLPHNFWMFPWPGSIQAVAPLRMHVPKPAALRGHTSMYWPNAICFLQGSELSGEGVQVCPLTFHQRGWSFPINKYDTDDKESLVMVGWHGMTIYPIHHIFDFPMESFWVDEQWWLSIITSYIVPLCVPGCWSSCKTGRCGEIHRWGHAGRKVLYGTKLGETATTQMAIVQSVKMIEEVTSGQTDSRVSGSF